MYSVTRRLAGPAAVLLLAVLAGCGVPAETTPRRPDPPGGVHRTTPPTTPASPTAGPVVERLCLVKDDKLVIVKRRTGSEPTVDAQLRHLLAGPTESESDAGLTSALTGTNVVSGIDLAGTEAIIEVGDSLDGPSRSDQVLAYGQIVCTLDSRTDVNGVLFVRQGQPLGIPRGNGSLSNGPLTATDYAERILVR